MKINSLTKILSRELENSAVAGADRSQLRDLIAALHNVSEADLSSLTETLSQYNCRGGRMIRRPTATRREKMAKTIRELLDALTKTFGDDSAFESTIESVENAKLTKAELEVVYRDLFKTDKKFSKTKTKPDIIQAIRSERIARVRYRA